VFKDFFPAWLAIGNLSEQAGFLKERKRKLKKLPLFPNPIFLLKIEKEFPYFKPKKRSTYFRTRQPNLLV